MDLDGEERSKNQVNASIIQNLQALIRILGWAKSLGPDDTGAQLCRITDIPGQRQKKKEKETRQ